MAKLEPANHRDRVAASGVDLLLVALMASGTFAVTGAVDPPVRLGLLLLAVGLPTFLVEGALGRSLGKAGLQLRHAQPGDTALEDTGRTDGVAGHDLSIPQVAGRYVLKWMVPTVLVVLGLWLPALVWWTGLYLPALGPTRRTVHDRLTDTTVLGPTDSQRRTERAHDY